MPLINCETLARRLAEVCVLDCRYDLGAPAAGEEAYRREHIPGAHYADLARHLSGKTSGGNGRHPLPAHDDAAAFFSACGIGDSSEVVVYDDISGAFAARCWWLLRYLGHDKVSVLDGGFSAWLRGGYPVSPAPAQNRAAVFTPRPREAMRVNADDILNAAHTALIDARQAARWRGESEPIDAVKGRIPGALNYPFENNLQSDGCFLPPRQLRASFADAAGADAAHYCGSGVTACHNILALHIAGLPEGRLYPGSWSEWIAGAARPVERS